MSAVAQPKVRPLERFWPYADLSEQLSVEEQAALDPDLYEALYGRRPDRPFSITLVFPDLDLPDFARALELARQSPDFRQTGNGPLTRYRARFQIGDAARLREVFSVVGRSADTEILVDDQAWPYGRELWIPLVGFFVNP
ncbi:MAG TPA: hypothetical protein VFP91_00350 [Vicinamibacterales bacterium]|nr:hypothetical protein [Vicinamibacterales bacterium]